MVSSSTGTSRSRNGRAPPRVTSTCTRARSTCVRCFVKRLEDDGMLVNGKWTAGWHPVQSKDAKGGFVRQESQFRNWITGDGGPGPTGEGGFLAEAGRYHLYVALT